MATLTFDQELLNTPSYNDRTSGRQAPSNIPSFTELLGIVSYKQGLVEFADSKAGSLILLNSLLIAAVGALPSNGELGGFKLASVAGPPSPEKSAFPFPATVVMIPKGSTFRSR